MLLDVLIALNTYSDRDKLKFPVDKTTKENWVSSFGISICEVRSVLIVYEAISPLESIPVIRKLVVASLQIEDLFKTLTVLLKTSSLGSRPLEKARHNS